MMDKKDNKMHDEACPVCVLVMGYCGGSAHWSCGHFHNGVAVSRNEFHKNKLENKGNNNA